MGGHSDLKGHSYLRGHLDLGRVIQVAGSVKEVKCLSASGIVLYILFEAKLQKQLLADPGFPRNGAPTQTCALTYSFTKFSPKIHENEKILGPNRPFPIVPSKSANANT